jgi:hypothetical protein
LEGNAHCPIELVDIVEGALEDTTVSEKNASEDSAELLDEDGVLVDVLVEDVVETAIVSDATEETCAGSVEMLEEEDDVSFCHASVGSPLSRLHTASSPSNTQSSYTASERKPNTSMPDAVSQPLISVARQFCAASPATFNQDTAETSADSAWPSTPATSASSCTL